MIAALLPLPPRPVQEMEERDNSTSNLGLSNDNFNDYERQFGPMDEARYESARWWRRLNRWMSLVGALIVAAIVSFPRAQVTVHRKHRLIPLTDHLGCCQLEGGLVMILFILFKRSASLYTSRCDTML